MVRSAHTAPLRHAAQTDQGRQFLAPAVQPQHSCTHLSATLTPPRTRRCGVRCRRHACRGGPRCGWLLRRNRRGDMAVSSSRGRIVFSGGLPGPTPCLQPPFAGRPSVRAVSRPPLADVWPRTKSLPPARHIPRPHRRSTPQKRPRGDAGDARIVPRANRRPCSRISDGVRQSVCACARLLE